jgi:multiple sugar transport system substrate-binding protein
VTAWQAMPAGVDKKAPLSQIYDKAVLDAVAKSPESFTRWGLPQNQGALAGAVSGQFVLPKALATVITSGGDPAEATKKAADQARQIQEEVAP